MRRWFDIDISKCPVHRESGNVSRVTVHYKSVKGTFARMFSALLKSSPDVVKSLQHSLWRYFPDHGNKMTLDEIKDH